ncbi:hypothetical protein J6590_006311 [Homalodisca vitripennis]|nr:hypothetical protein J6590_006311 [Homalodisca vitripennis]
MKILLHLSLLSSTRCAVALLLLFSTRCAIAPERASATEPKHSLFHSTGRDRRVARRRRRLEAREELSAGIRPVVEGDRLVISISLSTVYLSTPNPIGRRFLVIHRAHGG